MVKILRDIEAITFDFNETLLKISYDPAQIPLDFAKSRSLQHFDIQLARNEFDRIFLSLHNEYQEASSQDDPCPLKIFWKAFYSEWLEAIQLPLEKEILSELVEFTWPHRIFSSSVVYSPYGDVRPTLEGLKARGYRLGIISNGGPSLHQTLKGMGLSSYFEVVTASTELGILKPHSAIFKHTLKQLKANPQKALHVGDSFKEDYEGALKAGMRALLLDRKLEKAKENRIHTLLELLNEL